MNEAIVVRRWGGWNFGYEHSIVVGKTSGEKYLERRFFKLLGMTFRLHKFYRGDDDRALHDHPWDFITFPLKGYWERHSVDYNRCTTVRYVQAWRFHFREATFRHMVLGDCRYIQNDKKFWCSGRPWYTLVFTFRKKRSWGFWPDGKFVPWRMF
jgi:hypothetical protein